MTKQEKAKALELGIKKILFTSMIQAKNFGLPPKEEYLVKQMLIREVQNG